MLRFTTDYSDFPAEYSDPVTWTLDHDEKISIQSDGIWSISPDETLQVVVHPVRVSAIFS